MLLLQLLELMLLLLLLVHQGYGYITGGSCSLQGRMNQRGPDDRTWAGRHRAASSRDPTPTCSGGCYGILHGRHTVMFDNLLHQDAVAGAQAACCKAAASSTSRTPSTPASTVTHTAP